MKYSNEQKEWIKDNYVTASWDEIMRVMGVNDKDKIRSRVTCWRNAGLAVGIRPKSMKKEPLPKEPAPVKQPSAYELSKQRRLVRQQHDAAKRKTTRPDDMHTRQPVWVPEIKATIYVKQGHSVEAAKQRYINQREESRSNAKWG